MGYGIPRPARDRLGGRVGERPSYLHDRVRFPCPSSRPPSEPSNLAPLRPSSSTPSSSLFYVTPRRPRGVRCSYFHYHHDYKGAMSGTLSSYVPLSSSLDQAGQFGGVYITSPQPEYSRHACPRLLRIHGFLASSGIRYTTKVLSGKLSLARKEISDDTQRPGLRGHCRRQL